MIHLTSRGSSVVIECLPGEAPIWRHWGRRVELPSGLPFTLRSTRTQPPASLEHDQPLSVVPTFGMGWFGQSALLAHRNGCDFAQHWTACTVLKSDVQAAQFELIDQVACVRLLVNLALDHNSDVLSMSCELFNDSPSTLDLSWLAAATLPLPAWVDRVESPSGQWAGEFATVVEPLSNALWRKENRRGRSSHSGFCGAYALGPGASDDNGMVYGAHLAWSGNHGQCIEKLTDGRSQWQLGEWLAPGEIRLAEGERLVTPTVFAACSDAGKNGLMQRFHILARAQSCRGGRAQANGPRPIHLNTWEAVYFQHSESDLFDLADAAAKVGVERFVLDDGWFKGRSDDRRALGDWVPDAQKYPNGLSALAQHVIGLGLQFGLWIEPEMCSPDSDLYREHPDWVLQLQGRPTLTARNQLVLDLSKAEVAEHLFKQLSRLLIALPICYIKWDMNRDLAPGASGGISSFHAQTRAVYRLLAQLNAAFPALEIENCASGGGRADFGLLPFTDRIWITDCNDALGRLSIGRNAMHWFPPELLGAHVGSAPSHTTGCSQPMAFRCAVAATGHFGIELDPRVLNEADAATLRRWTHFYRAVRGELHQKAVWCGDAGDSLVWQAHGSDRHIILMVFRVEPSKQQWSPGVRLSMLRRDASYRVERIDPECEPKPDHACETFFDLCASGGASVDGGWLVESGLPLPRMNAQVAMVFRIAVKPLIGQNL